MALAGLGPQPGVASIQSQMMETDTIRLSERPYGSPMCDSPSQITPATTPKPSSLLSGSGNRCMAPAQKFIQEKDLKRNEPHNADADPWADDDNYPVGEITMLKRSNWVRTCEYTYVKHPQWCYVRVYVLPDDAGHKYIDRSSKTLREALKVVMSKVNRSVDAWDGIFFSNEQVTDGNSNGTGTEDESLWYIFNTLRNPEPQVEAVKDPYARLAMRQLLSAEDAGNTELDAGVAGLKTPLYPYQRRSAAFMVQREAQPAQMLDPRLQLFKGPNGLDLWGILAETMGCGKTLICLAVILATRCHVPAIPPLYREGEVKREKCASLVEMAARAAGQSSMPWKSYFDRLGRSGMTFARCIKACEDNRGAYKIPSPPTRHSGRSGVAYPRPPPQLVRLTSGTLIVVPPNLVDHWEEQIARHSQGLKVLVLRNMSNATPSSDELLQYDIILFSRWRFDQEAGEAVNNRRGVFNTAESSLFSLHWLRIIIDEGHNVAGSSQTSRTRYLLDKLHIERRWIVSGTPSGGLYGVEVSLASHETNTSSDTDLSEATEAVLQGKRKTEARDDQDLRKLKPIVVNFFDLKPWSNPLANDHAEWAKYMRLVGKDGKRRKVQSLRATLQSLVVRHRMEVIHSEITLPKLYNKVVYLEPTFYDRLNLNLFIFVLAVNAITSEREGDDYMFHTKNKKHLRTLINNLRQAGFWWAGSNLDLSATVKNALEYLEKKRAHMSKDDITTLTEGIEIAEKAFSSGAWNAFRQLNELGVYIRDFPSHARALWALDPSKSDTEPLHMGIYQACRAQQFVKEHLKTVDPTEGLAGAGIKARREQAEAAEKQGPELGFATFPKSKKAPKKSFSKGLTKSLPADSPLAQTKLLGTTSAKLSYLLSRVMELHTEEKIIIFYDSTNSGVWIAEGLDLLGIEYRMYASTLSPELRTKSEEIRVFLMDLHQASHGLHIANASRPNVESQAIKRAHRIGQTRPVDTLEDKMLKRRKAMSEKEMQEAEKDLLDDSTMSSIIQNERFIPIPEDEDSAHVAYLSKPSGFFDRHKLAIPDDEGDAEKSPPKRKRPSSNTKTLLDAEPDILTPKKRKSSTGLVFLSPGGILMTPMTGIDQEKGGSRAVSEATNGVQQSPGSIFGP
ncbi:DEAD/DEAH box helicase [Aspergillus novofumigatus IBT 16806]|uniref:Putative SNF2 family helicase n=1 Tax=Aspergillus novofumigatus (strain IBT 16806) TaxID=1392255 RepID=A0A2I1C4Y7_ASPN1|nr:putative SNF2 family helicase [Aspergillus novofumigatus IBT 16806]PKX92688.1 putative SNF2 family helicase [Aspergillus novofumigatus IBT 16806]